MPPIHRVAEYVRQLGVGSPRTPELRGRTMSRLVENGAKISKAYSFIDENVTSHGVPTLRMRYRDEEANNHICRAYIDEYGVKRWRSSGFAEFACSDVVFPTRVNLTWPCQLSFTTINSGRHDVTLSRERAAQGQQVDGTRGQVTSYQCIPQSIDIEDDWCVEYRTCRFDWRGVPFPPYDCFRVNMGIDLFDFSRFIIRIHPARNVSIFRRGGLVLYNPFRGVISDHTYISFVGSFPIPSADGTLFPDDDTVYRVPIREELDPFLDRVTGAGVEVRRSGIAPPLETHHCSFRDINQTFAQRYANPLWASHEWPHDGFNVSIVPVC